MSVNEMRKDYILDRWTVIAAQRKRRPTDFARPKEERSASACPFCPGNENMTPPAVLVYLEKDRKIVSERDSDDYRHKNWLVRCFPNLYPAFAPPSGEIVSAKTIEPFESKEAFGHHEVVVESPRHDEHPGVAPISQLVHVIHACRDRLEALYSSEYVKYVSIFRNHGSDAGASLSHAHTQIIATPIFPCIVEEELEKSKIISEHSKKCVFCSIVEYEKTSLRAIWENNSFTAFCPWASVHPYEFWIFPKRHQSTILDMSKAEVTELANTMRVCFGGLRNLINDPSYNFGFHMSRERHYHWHLEVYPRLTIWAGLEKSTGTYINVMPPEEAAKSLREAAHQEEERNLANN